MSRLTCLVLGAGALGVLALSACSSAIDEKACRKLKDEAFAVMNKGTENLCLSDADCVVAEWPDACGRVTTKKVVETMASARKQFTDGKCDATLAATASRKCPTLAPWCKQGICINKEAAMEQKPPEPPAP
ncbi:MAG: hypothetical protein HY908_10545 [Myxococcales bacterium]|nr:hypothetical protein [Myxococcales bacterium]MCC6526684.1 hypothetical protein [Polyangiaceae bacterium]